MNQFSTPGRNHYLAKPLLAMATIALAETVHAQSFPSKPIRAIKTPEAAGKMQSIGYEVWGYPPEEFAAMIRRDVELIARIIRESNIKIEN